MSSPESGLALVIRHTGQRFPLTQVPVTLGRHTDNTIVLSDPQASRHHASISWQAGTYVVQDLGSANGTYVNERRIAAPQPLRHGYVLRVGNTIFDVQQAAAAREGERTMAAPSTPPRHRPPADAGRRSALPIVLGLLVAGIVVVGLAVAAILLLTGEGKAEPTVAILSPSQGAQIAAGQEVIIQTTASGARDISRLELKVDDVLVAMATSPEPDGMASLTASQPWTFGQAGPHVIAVVAYTVRGKTSAPALVAVNVVEALGQVTPTPTSTTGPTPTETPIPPTTAPPPSVPPPDTAVPTDTPSPTPTATNTPTPTTTPTPTPTTTPSPTPLIQFWAEATTIPAGGSTFLHWHVEHVLEIYLDGAPVTGPDGQQEVSPAVTTTYRLRVVYSGGEETQEVTIEVAPGEVTVTLTSQAALDGYVIGGQGSYNNQEIRVGNYGTASGENVYRGFMSFDMSGIPTGATIQAIQLRFYQEAIVGDPYGKLPQLFLVHVDYGPSLEAGDFDTTAFDSAWLSPHTAPGQWYTITSSTIATWITQNLAAGRPRLQMRLQYSPETDDGVTADYARLESGDNFFGTGNRPQITITYTP